MDSTKFSDFIRNATVEERERVYMKAMELAAMVQAKKMRIRMAERAMRNK